MVAEVNFASTVKVDEMLDLNYKKQRPKFYIIPRKVIVFGEL